MDAEPPASARSRAPEGGDTEVLDAMRRWLDSGVIRLNLCPFAAAVTREGLVRWHVVRAPATEALEVRAEPIVRAALDEAQRLLEADPARVATTLVVVPEGAGSFEDFADIAATVDVLLEEAGAQALVQLAWFHPEFRFEGSAGADPGDYAGRAPHPALHLLRADEVEEAIARHPDAEGIAEANAAHLRELGLDAVRRTWQDFARRASGPQEAG